MDRTDNQLELAVRTLIHEIKNPLTAINIQCDILKDSVPESCKADIEGIEKEATHISQLVEHFSEFLSDSVGNPEPVEIVPFVNGIVRNFKAEIRTDSDKFPTDGTSVYFDKIRLRSILENLIKNACESCSVRDPEVEIKLETVTGDFIVMKIGDRGTGISPEIMSKLFTPFFTTKDNGTGIGLALAKRFTEAGGGTLSLKNREGGGTVAELVLPAHKPGSEGQA